MNFFNMRAEHYKRRAIMTDIRQTIVFSDTAYVTANKIICGETCVIIPFRYGMHRGSKIFLFFPDLKPAPLIFEATVTDVNVGSPAGLQKLALEDHRDACVLLDKDVNDASAMAISWDARLIPMSKEDIVNTAYAEGKLPEPE